MAVPTPLFSEELLTALYTKSYTGIVSYLSPHDHLTVPEIDHSTLATSHWLDELRTIEGKKSTHKRVPNAVFKVFAWLDDQELVCSNMVSQVTSEFNLYSAAGLVCLKMHKLTLSTWIGKIQNSKTPADELAVYALSQMYGKHSVIYTKIKTWTTVGTSQPLTERELYNMCDLKFVSMGKGRLVELICKPSSLMPVVQTQPLSREYIQGWILCHTNNQGRTNGFQQFPTY